MIDSGLLALAWLGWWFYWRAMTRERRTIEDLTRRIKQLEDEIWTDDDPDDPEDNTIIDPSNVIAIPSRKAA